MSLFQFNQLQEVNWFALRSSLNTKTYWSMAILACCSSSTSGSGVAFNHLLEGEEKGASDWTSAVIFDLKFLVVFGYNSESFYGGVSYQGTSTTQDKYSVIKFGCTRGCPFWSFL